MNWSAGHIEVLKNKGLKVKFSDPVSKDRTIEVISNGKKETVKIRKAMEHEESKLQQNCVKTFRLIYPKYKMRLFSIPNEAIRSAENASRMLSQGLMPGALDMILAIPKGKYGAAFIEFKSEDGRLSEHQIIFIKEMSENYYCMVIRSVECFIREIKEYLEK